MPADLDVYSYVDYRAFCRDFYNTQKSRSRGFSYRSFARRAQVAPAYLKHVIDGKRNLSPETSIKFSKGMGLSQKESDYFETLVRFNQASTTEEKSIYFESLRKKRARNLKALGLAEAAVLLSHWYVVALKELVVNLNTIEPGVLQRALRKTLPEDLIRKTVEDLQDLGWLSFEEGYWKSAASQVQFPDEMRSYVIRSFHSQMLQLAQEALGDELEEREFGSAVFTIPKDCVPELKEKIKELQRDFISYVQDVARSQERSEHQVYYLGIQCFALQKREREKLHESD